MGFLSNLKGVIYKLDFFYTAELLRYREEPQYRTIFGGILSVSIIILLLVTFYNKVLNTFEKVIINSSVSSTSADDPTPYTISTMPGKPFMFGVQIWHHDLNTAPRYFDINLLHAHLDTGEYNADSADIPLQPCTREHWSQYPAILQGFDRLNIRYWLCLPKNKELQIQGKYSSVLSKALQISVSKCTNASSTIPCATDAQINQFFANETNFYFTLYFVNPLINADSQQFLSYYLEDANYIMFSAHDGEECQLMVEDYTIQTDQSIIPLAQSRTDEGGIITKTCIKNRYTIDTADTEPLYATFFFYKSPLSIQVERSFQKIDEILSYIGGLFGTIAICLFLVNVYNSYSFQITIGGYLYKPSDEQMGKQLKKYQFLHFLLHLFYMILDLFKCSPPCTTTKLYHDCREEMVKQLDILYLLRRVTFLQRGIASLMTDKQLRALHLLQNRTLDEAKKDRRKYKWTQQTFLYKFLRKGGSSQGRQSNSAIKDNKNNPNQIKNDFQFTKQPNMVTVSGMGISFDQTLNKNTTTIQKSKKITLDPDHQLSSQQESQEDETDNIIRDLTDLKEDTQNSSISRKIWNRLSQNVKAVIDGTLELQQENRQMEQHKNNHMSGIQDDSFDLSLKKLQRKPKMRRFKQLPTLTFPQGVKVQHWQQKQQQKEQQQQQKKIEKISDDYIQMKDYSPVKKRNK